MVECINSFPDFAGSFGDKRIDKKATELLHRLVLGRHSSIRYITKNEAEQRSFYRLLDNESFSEKAIEQSITHRLGELCKDRHLLCIQDTTEFNLTSKKNRIQPNSGLGKTAHEEVLGFMLHTSLVVDTHSNFPLGFSYIKAWNRDVDTPDRHQRKYQQQPLEAKESYRWVQASEQSKTILQNSQSITIVADRESDIYDLLAIVPDAKTHLLIRSNFDRKLVGGHTLDGHLSQLPTMHHYHITIEGDVRRATDKQTIELSLKWDKVSILKSASCRNPTLPHSIEIYVVEARQTDKADGIHWRILTTHPIQNAGQAMQIIDWYKQRWNIEQVHRLLKKEGIGIESSQLEKGWAIRKLTLMALMAALRVLQMMLAYRSDSEQPADEVFTKDQQKCLSQANGQLEGQTDKQKNPHTPYTLKWATWIIARLGGWKGYKSQRKPGPIVFQKGLVRFYQMFEGWRLYEKHLNVVYTQ